MIGLVKGLKGYEGVSQKDYEYVLAETGFADKSDFDFEEFVEICGELKDILLSPGPKSKARVAERARIPVEKSGGGV